MFPWGFFKSVDMIHVPTICSGTTTTTNNYYLRYKRALAPLSAWALKINQMQEEKGNCWKHRTVIRICYLWEQSFCLASEHGCTAKQEEGSGNPLIESRHRLFSSHWPLGLILLLKQMGSLITLNHHPILHKSSPGPKAKILRFN